jgi:hypothetical protein
MPFDQLPSQQIALPQVTPPANPSALNFQMFAQKGTEWCWAAVASSVSKYLAAQGSAGGSYEQCQVARLVLPVGPPAIATADCCTNGGAASCPGQSNQYNVEADLAQALRQTQHMVEPPAGPLDFNTIQQEIVNNRRPVCIRFTYTSQDAHLLAICDAYRDPQGIATYVLADPMHPDLYPQSAESLLTSYRNQSGSWSNTYFTQ